MNSVTDIVLVLALGMAVGWLAKRLHQPSAVWLVFLGLILGPPMMDWVTPSDGLHLLGELGVVLLLGMAGLHLGLGQLRSAGIPGMLVALLGMIFCFVGGYIFSAWWGSSSEEAIYVATVLTATSIGISVQVLHQFGLIDNSIGRIVIAAAVIDDVIALYLLAIAHGALTDGLSVGGLITSVGLAAVVLISIFLLCRIAARTLVRYMASPNVPTVLLFSVITIVSAGAMTQQLGYSFVVGGFFSGLGIGEGLPAKLRKQLIAQLARLVFVLVPFFFVLIGLRVEWNVLGDPGMPLLFTGLAVVAILGKVMGGILGAYSIRGFMTKLLIGISMVPRGEVALVIASLGFAQGHISHHVMIALILVAVVAALLGPMFIAVFARYAAK